MRMMLKATIPVEAGNEAIRNGTLPKTMQSMMQSLRPEAAYFFADNGLRTALFVFNMDDASRIPVIAEPLFMGMNAALTMIPVMNAEDLQKGLTEAAKSF